MKEKIGKIENHETNLQVVLHETKETWKEFIKKKIQNKMNELREAQIYEMKRNMSKESRHMT